MSPPRKPKNFWDDSETTLEDVKRGTANREKVLEELIDHALSTKSLDASLVAEWHKACFLGLSYVSKDDECLLGAYRGSDHPRLKGMRVGVLTEGAPPGTVNDELKVFFGNLNTRMSTLANTIKIDQDKSEQQLRQIAEVAGWAHGEWVRIHPFANGSGRTARLIANWVLVRFRLNPVVRVRPRPEFYYEVAAIVSMQGDHHNITQFILDLLLEGPPV